jgi:hypothetical protein
MDIDLKEGEMVAMAAFLMHKVGMTRREPRITVVFFF